MNEVPYFDTFPIAFDSWQQYHSKSVKYLTYDLLSLFTQSPRRYHDQRDSVPVCSDAMHFTMALRARIIKGREALERDYVLTSSSYAAWAHRNLYDGQARRRPTPVLDAEQVAVIEQMAVGVFENHEARMLILNSRPNHTANAYYRDYRMLGRLNGIIRAYYCDVPCQGWVDCINRYCGIIQLFVCDDLQSFEWDAQRLEHYRRCAFLRSILAEILDGAIVPVQMIAIERMEPYRCGMWRASSEALAEAQQENEVAMRRLNTCQYYDEWPAEYGSVCSVGRKRG